MNRRSPRTRRPSDPDPPEHWLRAAVSVRGAPALRLLWLVLSFLAVGAGGYQLAGSGQDRGPLSDSLIPPAQLGRLLDSLELEPPPGYRVEGLWAFENGDLVVRYCEEVQDR